MTLAVFLLLQSNERRQSNLSIKHSILQNTSNIVQFKIRQSDLQVQPAQNKLVYRDCLVLKQMLKLLVLFPELPEDQGPICCRHHFLCKGQRILTCKNKRHIIKVPVTIMSTTANWHSFKMYVVNYGDDTFHER